MTVTNSQLIEPNLEPKKEPKKENKEFFLTSAPIEF